MSETSERGRPRSQAAPATSTKGVLPSIADSVTASEVATHIDGTFVLLVSTTAGRYRRRCFLSVNAAERAARRATAAGHNAVVVLAELKPLYRLTGNEVS